MLDLHPLTQIFVNSNTNLSQNYKIKCNLQKNIQLNSENLLNNNLNLNFISANLIENPKISDKINFELGIQYFWLNKLFNKELKAFDYFDVSLLEQKSIFSNKNELKYLNLINNYYFNSNSNIEYIIPKNKYKKRKFNNKLIFNHSFNIKSIKFIKYFQLFYNLHRINKLKTYKTKFKF